MTKKFSGRCACGSIRYQLLAQPMFVHCCHCDDCQRLTDSAFVLNAIIETQAIKLLRGKPVAVPVPRENGPHDIYRCPKCQTAVWSDYGHRPNLRFVRVGTLDKPGALKPDVHIHTRWKAKWLKLPKGTPTFRNYYETSKPGPKPASNACTPRSEDNAHHFRRPKRHFNQIQWHARAALTFDLTFGQTTGANPSLRFSVRTLRATRPNARCARATNAGCFSATVLFRLFFIRQSNAEPNLHHRSQKSLFVLQVIRDYPRWPIASRLVDNHR